MLNVQLLERRLYDSSPDYYKLLETMSELISSTWENVEFALVEHGR